MRDDLIKIAKTTLGSKILSQHSNHFAKLAVDAILRLGENGALDSIQVIKKLGGSMADSYLDEGFLLEKKPGMYQPQRIEDAKILIANTPMDTDKVGCFRLGSGGQVTFKKKINFGNIRVFKPIAYPSSFLKI